MSPAQLKAMEAGRRRAARLREREGVARVKAWRKWISAGSPLGRIPEVPSDADYAAARRRGL